MKLIPNWQEKKLTCYFCRTSKSVKYVVNVLDLFQEDEPFEVNACSMCALLNKEGERNERAKKKRKYYRKCGICGERHEQSEMVRTDCSPSGWICLNCHSAEHPEYDIDEW